MEYPFILLKKEKKKKFTKSVPFFPSSTQKKEANTIAFASELFCLLGKKKKF
jgi:hypothetical protein